MVMVASKIPGVAILDVSWSMAEAVPNGLPLAVLVPSTFDLVARSRNAPRENHRGK